jgi:hypothetical protein
MKKAFLYIILLLLTICSCRKESILEFGNDPSITAIYGTWKLVSRENYATNQVFYKESADIQPYCNGAMSCDVILTLERVNAKDKISGHTITNEIFGEFTFDQVMHRINIAEFGGTKLGEPAWSDNIWKNIYEVKSYKINGQYLRLYMANKPESLTFERQ